MNYFDEHFNQNRNRSAARVSEHRQRSPVREFALPQGANTASNTPKVMKSPLQPLLRDRGSSGDAQDATDGRNLPQASNLRGVSAKFAINQSQSTLGVDPFITEMSFTDNEDE